MGYMGALNGEVHSFRKQPYHSLQALRPLMLLNIRAVIAPSGLPQLDPPHLQSVPHFLSDNSGR